MSCSKYYQDGMSELAISILECAINDYKSILRYGCDDDDYYFDTSTCEKISRKELVKFFKSSWCESLLMLSGCRMTGSEIMLLIEKNTDRNIEGSE